MSNHYDREPGDDPSHTDKSEHRVVYPTYKRYIPEGFYTIEDIAKLLKEMKMANALMTKANEKSMRKIP